VGQNDHYISFPDAHTIRVYHQPFKRDIAFELNHIFSPDQNQEAVYEDINPLIKSALDGYNACIMAYG